MWPRGLLRNDMLVVQVSREAAPHICTNGAKWTTACVKAYAHEDLGAALASSQQGVVG